EAVHRRRVERRDVEGARHVLGQDAPERLVDRDRLRRERPDRAEHGAAGVVDWEQVWDHAPIFAAGARRSPLRPNFGARWLAILPDLGLESAICSPSSPLNERRDGRSPCPNWT